jgi:putrescine aminotransferase
MDSASTSELLKWDKEHVIHPMAPVGTDPTIVMAGGEGIYVKDSDGKQYLDGASQLTCINLGYGQTEIADAVAEQMKQLAYSHSFFGNCNTANIECSRKLAQLTPTGLNHFFYTLGGSGSIDTSFRIARTYWKNKNKGGKFKIISLHNSYHGVNFGAVSATALRYGQFAAWVQPVVPGFLRIPSYYCYRCGFDLKYPDCGIECAKFLAYTIKQEGPDNVAAFVAEPVHGTAGSIVPPPEYWPMVRKICTENDVLLIADEVMTGFGRTGKMFGTQHWDVVPDIMALAKGLTSAYLPLGAVAIIDEVAEGLKGAPVFGFTYSGHPVCSAAATKVMEIYERDNVVENAAEMGGYALNRLKAECESMPCVGEVAGIGLMIGIEIVQDKPSHTPFPVEQNVPMGIGNEAREKGLLIRASDRLAFTPPLIIKKDEVDKAIDILVPILGAVKP